MALDPDDCPHEHVTYKGQGPPIGPLYVVCFDCDTMWLSEDAPLVHNPVTTD